MHFDPHHKGEFIVLQGASTVCYLDTLSLYIRQLVLPQSMVMQSIMLWIHAVVELSVSKCCWNSTKKMETHLKTDTGINLAHF